MKNNMNKTNTAKNVVELRSEIYANGTRMENVYVNGNKFACIGYVSEEDKAACLRAIQTAIDSSDNVHDAMQKLMTIANLGDNDVEPDEQIEVGGFVGFLSYKDKTIYNAIGQPVVDYKDLKCKLPKEGAKALLMERLNAKLADRYNNDDDYEDDEEEEW